jgi:hypothetical protein
VPVAVGFIKIILDIRGVGKGHLLTDIRFFWRDKGIARHATQQAECFASHA